MSFAGAPRYTLVASEDGVRVLETASGESVGVLWLSGEGINVAGIAMSTDSKDFYWGTTSASPPCESQLWRGRLDGAPATVVADGIGPALSRDGRYVAFAARGTPSTIYGNQCLHNSVRILDNTTGAVISAWNGEGEYGVGHIAWSPDSRSIAFDLVNEGGVTRRFDLDSELSTLIPIDGTRSLFPLAEYGLTPRWTHGGKLIVSLGCYGCMQFLPVLGIADDGRAAGAVGFGDLRSAQHDGWVLDEHRYDGSNAAPEVVAPNGQVARALLGVRNAAWPADSYLVAEPTRFEKIERPVEGAVHIDGAALVDARGPLMTTPVPPSQLAEVKGGFVFTVPRAAHCPPLLFSLDRTNGRARQIGLGDGVIVNSDANAAVLRYRSDSRCAFGWMGRDQLVVTRSPWTPAATTILVPRLPTGRWTIVDYGWDGDRVVAVATCSECTAPQTIALREDDRGYLTPTG